MHNAWNLTFFHVFNMFVTFFGLCWLANIWQLRQRGATAAPGAEFKFLRRRCKLSFHLSLYCTPTPERACSQANYAVIISFHEVGGGGGSALADMVTLLIVHFKVLVFPHQWKFFFQQSPQYFRGKPNTQQDLKTHFILVLWTVSQHSRP